MKKKQKITLLLTLCMLVSLFTPALQAKAAQTKEVYLLKQYNAKGVSKEKYSYDKNGLLVKSNNTTFNIIDKYTYQGQLLTKQVQTDKNSIKQIWELTYDNNRLAQINYEDNYDFKYTSKYSYDKKGRISKRVYKETGAEAAAKPSTYKYTYNNKGYITKIKITGILPDTVKYTYDKNGTVKTYKNNYSDYSMKAEYESGNLSTLIIKDLSSEDKNDTVTYTFTYEKVKIPESYLDTVEAQQKALLNFVQSAPQFVFGN